MRLLFEEPMVFVCCRDHRMAQRKTVNIADLADEEFVGFPPGFGLRRLVDDAFRTVGADPPVSEARKSPDLPSVRLNDPVIWQVFLASPSATRMSPATIALTDLLLDAAVRARGR